MEYIVTQRKQ